MPDAEHTILLVDDEAPILRALQRLFRREGYRILTAEGGEQALTLLADTEDPVSLIISDQRMPGMNGAQFLEQSRKTAPDAIRFLLTGYSDLDAVVASINRGEIQRYLTKPWNDQDLLLQARQAIEQVELRRENRRLLELTRQQNMELQAFNQKLEKKVEARTKAITDKNKKLSRANTALNRSLVDTVRLLASLIQTLNPFLGNQMKDTAKLALQLGRRLGLKSDVLENIELAATIHDIGLIGGSEKLSRKDILEVSSLEATEYRQHPIVGSVCLQAMERMAPVADIVLHHHEAFDGSGFPAGLQGDDIPLGARIVGPVSDYVRLSQSWPDNVVKIMTRAKHLLGAAADDIMMTDRDALVATLNRKCLLARAQKMYDPEIVMALIAMLDKTSGDADSAAAAGGVRHVHYDELQVGMRIAMEIRTRNGRFVLPADSVLNKMLLKGVQRLGREAAIVETVPIIAEERNND